MSRNTGRKVEFDYLIKRCPLCLLSRGVAMETSRQAPRGARLEPITEAAARSKPTTGRCTDSTAVQRDRPSEVGFRKAVSSAGMEPCLTPDSQQGRATLLLCHLSPWHSSALEPRLGHSWSGCTPSTWLTACWGPGQGRAGGWRSSWFWGSQLNLTPAQLPDHGFRPAWQRGGPAQMVANMVTTGGCPHSLLGGVAQLGWPGAADDIGMPVT